MSGDVISALTAQARLGPRTFKTPHGQACHVTQIPRSDWSKFEILRSDWLRPLPLPYSSTVMFDGLFNAFHHKAVEHVLRIQQNTNAAVSLPATETLL